MPDANGVLSRAFDATNNALRVTGVGDVIVLGAGEFVASVGTPAPTAAPASGDVARLAFDGAATETASAPFFLPNWWASFAVDLYHVNDTAGTGNIRWSIAVKALGTNELVTEAAAFTGTATTASGAQHTQAITQAVVTGTHTVFLFGGNYVLNVSRLGGDGLDTHAGDIGLLAAHIRRTG